MATPDRLEALLAQNVVTGIDFVYVYPNQATLDVFFLRPPGTLSVPLVNNVAVSQVRIYSPSGGEVHPVVPVTAVAWAMVDGRDVLRLTTSFPGDFSRYRLAIDDPRIDSYFNDVVFSFKANCPSDLDCKPGPHECPPEPTVDFPVNYLGRDFWSFRQALLDFASERYPDWQDRLEADAGIMLAEAMSALGDELAYYQDRVGREAYLESASQRRSLRRHARLVDYQVHDGLGASTWLDVTVDPMAVSGTISAGSEVTDVLGTVVYGVGHGLRDSSPGYQVRAARNQFAPHLWDENDSCLPVGATSLAIDGHHQADLLPLDDFSVPNRPGRWALLKTNPTDRAVQPRAWVVRLVAVSDDHDPVFNQDITRLTWEEGQATPFELDLTTLVVRGNLVPATAGGEHTEHFTIGTGSAGDPPAAVERQGDGGSVAYLFTLPGSDENGLVWLGSSPESAAPEVRLFEATRVGNGFVRGDEWEWRRSLLGVNSSQPTDRHFTLDDGSWRRVVGYRRIGDELVHVDYASGDGATVRFGDGEFGALPADGTIFEVAFRLGNGRRSNVSAGTLVRFDQAALPFMAAVTNPLAATGGVEPETPNEVRQVAPDAFRAVTLRAVRPEDYAEAVERLPWVQRAGAAFRWTGSWLTAFATPDPRGSVTVTVPQRGELADQLDRFRQAGREAYGLDPVYADLDIEVSVCVAPAAYRGEVKERLLEALLGKKGFRPRPGFFSPDNFTFGTPLERAALEAVVQDVAGVRAVENMRIRRRGWFDWRPFSELVFGVGDNEVLRVENDPFFPERGSLRLLLEGGA